MKIVNQLKNNKKLLISIGIMYLIIVSVYSVDRIFARHEKVINRIELEHPSGHGYEEVVYFNRLRVLRSFEPITLRDFLTANLLFLTSVFCFVTFILLRKIPSNTTNRKLYLLFAIAFLYFGLDEYFEIHGTIGLNLSYFIYPHESLEKIGHRDLGGVIMLFYAMLAFAVISVKVRFFKKNWLAFTAILIGFSFQAVAAVIDFFYTKLDTLLAIFEPVSFLLYRDEFYEITAAFLYFTGFLIYCRTSIAEKFQVTVK